MTPEYRELITSALKAHPGPWKQQDGYGDRGGRYTSIVDANGRDVVDGETGLLPEVIFNLLLNLPEILEDAASPSDGEISFTVISEGTGGP